jgi:hypothetical protein
MVNMQIEKQNNLKFCSKKSKGPKQDNQNELMSPMFERREP